MRLLRDVPGPQRRMLLATGAAAAVALVGAALTVVWVSGDPPEREYRPFRAGDGTRLAEVIREDGPVFFPDLADGDKAFHLALVDGEFAALRAVPPGRPASCPVRWDERAERFEDCDGRVWEPAELERYPVTVGAEERDPEDDDVLVDLREPLPPPAADGRAPAG